MENRPRIWTDDQVASLNAYQVAGVMHPFMCGYHAPGTVHEKHSQHSTELVAYPEGWRCPVTGEMIQDWAFDFMLDWSWAEHDFLRRTWDKEQGKWK